MFACWCLRQASCQYGIFLHLPLDCYNRSAIRSLALRLLGLSETSSSEGRMGLRVTAINVALCWQSQNGISGGQMQSAVSRLMNCLTDRSSNEWNEMTASRPPGRSRSRAWGNARSRAPNSSLTAISLSVDWIQRTCFHLVDPTVEV